MSEDKEAFLDRWSRLKKERPAEQRAELPAVPEAKKDEDPAPPLQPVSELNAESDFTPFMNAKVDPATRRDALKKLFVDPHYNIPDPFEPFSGDYTVEDPMSPEFLKTLNHARRLLFDEPEKPASAAAAAAEEPQQTEAQPQEPDNVAGKQDA